MKLIKFIIFTICIISSIGLFSFFMKKSDATSEKKSVPSENVTSTPDRTFYLKMQGEDIVIYEKENIIFEYTDLEPELLPSDVLTEVKKGISFPNQKELYEFLETYTS